MKQKNTVGHLASASVGGSDERSSQSWPRPFLRLVRFANDSQGPRTVRRALHPVLTDAT